jgi:hypothetical protein
MSKQLVAVSLMVAAVSLTAYAGKRERDVMTKETIPALREAEAKYKESCGCALAIDVDDTLQSIEEIRLAKNLAKNVTASVPKYCSDAASKKAMCQMKTLTVTKGHASFTFKDGHGIAMENGQEYTPFEMMTRVLDK